MHHDIHVVPVTVRTQHQNQFLDITNHILAVLQEHAFVQGRVLVQSQHTTARLWFNEGEELMHGDLVRRMEEMVPADYACDHDNFEIRDPATMCPSGECKNGVSHIRAAIFFQESVQLIARSSDNGHASLVTGEWGRVLLVELDHNRDRTFWISMEGYFARPPLWKRIAQWLRSLFA